MQEPPPGAHFFQKDSATVLERILRPELIAIQQSSEPRDNRARLMALAKAIREHISLKPGPTAGPQKMRAVAQKCSCAATAGGSMSAGISTMVRSSARTARGSGPARRQTFTTGCQAPHRNGD